MNSSNAHLKEQLMLWKLTGLIDGEDFMLSHDWQTDERREKLEACAYRCKRCGLEMSVPFKALSHLLEKRDELKYPYLSCDGTLMDDALK